ncbi:hypothetical protein [Pajaroellobacter abortibovis]|uniref:Outer membrane protein beta-barrel domain-containing protein n=1 Tax=Pajaroellobacter abortibovis TaxID=1882918 RepID=A0A1L6MZ30_9BACT|nr:hypothetical protein [Pajaroellobacter abortibovis]APS00834.1 hypothetical protein BCY86_01585 [Pajaroellobacter abortibovis]
MLGSNRTAQGQEIQLTGPLKGAPAVRNLRLYRKGRLEIAPTASFTLLDEYRRTFLTGGRVQYNLTDWLAVGAWGGYTALSMTTHLTDQIDETAVRNEKTALNINPSGFAEQTSKIVWMATPQISFIPFRGKMSLFEMMFIDTDVYFYGGAAFIGIKERGFCGSQGKLNCKDPASFELASRTAIAPTFGMGLTFYPTHFLSFGVEYRAFPFSWNRSGFDSKSDSPHPNTCDNQISAVDRTFKFNQMLSIFLGFSFPSKIQISD